MSEWQLLSSNGAPNPGAPVSGGGGTPLAGYRDLVDAKRSAATPRTPNAEFPDGYLGEVNSRRSDRLLQAVQSRLTQRNYQRGVHKGEKIDATDYFWPQQFGPDTGLQYEAQGLKWTATGSPTEQINHLGKNHLLTPEQMSEAASQVGLNPVGPGDPARTAYMQGLLPTWSC